MFAEHSASLFPSGNAFAELSASLFPSGNAFAEHSANMSFFEFWLAHDDFMNTQRYIFYASSILV